MKLKFTTHEVERSSSFTSSQFDIGDKRIIMEILRGKMYSNPIQSICQEIASNARDAHKEVGKDQQPIEIKLPSKLDPYFYIKDYGPGISPDRVANVYILYGMSTKRNDNREEGGFGLGSKTPFAYTDTFIVICVTTENEIRVRREYLAHIDESGLGQMTLVKEEETQDPQGTTVQFYVKEKDFGDFQTHVKRACAHWRVRPTIKGVIDWVWPEIEILYKGEKWEVHPTSPLDRRPYALIHDIPYNLNLRHIFSNNIPKEYESLSEIPLRLHFDIGEVPVTANREEIDYQEETIKHLRKRIEVAVNELREKLTAGLADCKNLRDAVVFWQHFKKTPYVSFMSICKWKDFQLKSYENIRIPHDSGIRAITFKRSNDNKYLHKKLADTSSLPISASTLFIEDDFQTKGVSRARLASAFEKPGVDRVVLVDFLKEQIKKTSDTGTIYYEVGFVPPETVIKRKKQINWDLLGGIKLSDLPKRIVSSTAAKTKYKTLKLKKFDRLNREWVAFSEDDEKLPIKFYVKTAAKSVYYAPGNSLKLSCPLSNFTGIISQIEALANIGRKKDDKISLTVFGVVPSQVKKLNGTWYPLDKYVGNVLESFKKNLSSTYHNKMTASSVLNYNMGQHLNQEKFKSNLSTNSLLLRYLDESDKTERICKQISIYNQVARRFRFNSLPDRCANSEIEKLANQIKKRYPLLLALSCGYGTLQAEISKDLLAYLEMKDKQMETQNEKN